MKARTTLIGGLIAVLGSTTVLMGAAASASAANAPDPTTSASADPAVAAFGGCLKGRGAGDLLLLVDSSGSLADTDPDNGRVKAANYLVDELAQYSGNADVRLDTAVATFDASYRPVLNWTPLSGGGVTTVHGVVDRLASANTGLETDYVSALQGARAALRQHVGGGEKGRCQAVIWLTDGQFDIAPRLSDQEKKDYGTTKTWAPGVQLTSEPAAAQAETIGRTELCRPGGTADQLRADGVETFAVGLGDANTFTLMKSIAIGGTGCGKLGSAASGDFTPAAGIDDLIFAFDRLGHPGGGEVNPPNRGVCSSVNRCSQAHTFVLDDSIQQVQLLGTANAAGIDVYVQGPGQRTPTKLTRSATATRLSLGAATASYNWPTDQTIALTLRRPSASRSWVGSWKVAFVDPSGQHLDAVSRTRLHITSDLTPAWLNDTVQLRAGDAKATFNFGLKRSTDAKADPLDPAALASTVVLSAQLRLADGSVIDFPALTKGDLSKPQNVDLSKVAPGAATLHLDLGITTADVPSSPRVPGTKLADTVVDLPVSIAAPANFPAVADSVDLGRHDAGESFDINVPLAGQGCAFLASAAVETAPADSAFTVTSKTATPDTCAAAGGTGHLALHVTTKRSQAGSVNGTLQVHLLSSDQPRRELVAPVAFTSDLQQPADATVRWVAFVIILVLGLLIPLLLLYGFNWLSSRIPGTQQILYGRVRAQLADGDVRRDGSGFVLRLADCQRQHPVPLNGARRLHIDGFDFRTKAGRNPMTPGLIQVTAPGGIRPLTSAEKPAMALKGQLPLTVQGSWVAVPSDPGTVDLLVLLGTGATEQTVQALAETVRQQLPHLAEQAWPDRQSPPGSGPPQDLFTSSSQARQGAGWNL